MKSSLKYILNKIIFHLRALLEQCFVCASPLGNPYFYDTKQFPWISELEAATPLIREELIKLIAAQSIPAYGTISSIQKPLSPDGGWKSYFFYVLGHRIAKNNQTCPHTEASLKKIPRMITAFFSLLEPGKKLPPHRGPYKGVLRYHLGLKIPQPAALCGIKVGEESNYWQEGKSLVFDDAFVHHAWNLSEESRVILFVDFERPLHFPMNIINRAVIKMGKFSSHVREILNGLKKLE